MPTHGVARQRFELQRVDFMSPEVSGRIGAVAAGWPLWTGSWDLTAMTEAQSEEWRAWVRAQRGAARVFFGRDLRRRLPMNYPAGLPGGFAGQASSWSVDGTRSVLTMNGLPGGFVLRTGDQVGFAWTTGVAPRRALVATVEAVQATGGGSVGVTVEPPVPTLVPPGAVATLNAPDCLMRLLPGTELMDMDVNRYIGARILAVQELLP